MSTNIEILRSRLVAVDRRLAELDGLELNGKSYAAQELRSERSNLLRLRSETKLQIAEAEAGPVVDQRKAKLIAQRAKEIEEQATAFADRLAAQGDHRQSRIWREVAIRSTETAAQELSNA